MSLVVVERRGSVGVITLNNPDQLNALAGSMLADAIAAIETFELDPGIRALLITGAGRGFCSGADLGGDRLTGVALGIADRVRSGVNRLILAMRGSRLPVVTALNGPAAGAGVGIALAGDFVLAARSAKLVLSFVRIGAALDSGASLLLPRLVGPMRARQMAMLGHPVDAQLAERWGLVMQVVEDGELMSEAQALAEALAAGPPLALARIKKELESSWTHSLEEALETEAVFQGEAFATADFLEGVAAYKARRAPRFTGH